MSRNVWRPKYNYRVKYITEAADMAKYSFVLQTSLCGLDLNYCEYSKNIKPVNNFSAYKRLNQLRDLLGRWHLDLPAQLEFISKDILVCKDMTPLCGVQAFFPLFHPGRFVVPGPVHFNKLDGVIVDFIKKSSDQLGTIRRFLTPIRVMKLYERSTWSLSLYEHFLPLLHQVCGRESSELVVDVIKSFGCRFLKWVLSVGKTDLEFFLYHAQRMGYDIWDVRSLIPANRFSDGLNRPNFPVRVPFNPVNECCIMGNLRNVRSLVKFGFDFVCSEEYLDEMKKYVFRCLTPRIEENDFLEDLQKNVDIATANLEQIGISLQRSCHLFLAVELFLFKIYVVMTSNKRAVKEGLGCIWNTIAEPYLCRSEVEAVFEGTSISQWPNAVVDFCRFYDSEICDGGFTDNYNPRSLTHLSRCKARNVLGENRQLPHGIETLNVPDPIKLYLSLGL